MIESKLEQNPHCVLTHEISLESYKFSWENVAIFSVSSYSERAEVRITLWKNNCGVSILQGCQGSWILYSYKTWTLHQKQLKPMLRQNAPTYRPESEHSLSIRPAHYMLLTCSEWMSRQTESIKNGRFLDLAGNLAGR